MFTYNRRPIGSQVSAEEMSLEDHHYTSTIIVCTLFAVIFTVVVIVLCCSCLRKRKRNADAIFPESKQSALQLFLLTKNINVMQKNICTLKKM